MPNDGLSIITRVPCSWWQVQEVETRALTRIAHLIGEHGVDPAQILAVTFTNKVAREMKERPEVLLAQRLAQSQYGWPEHSAACGAASVAFAHLSRSHQRTLDRHLPRVVRADAPLRHR